MPPSRRQTLFESVNARGRLRRHADVVCVTFDGAGSMVVSMQDFMQSQRWATAKMSSGNMLNDRGRFMEQILTVVSRPGSLVPTRGNPRQLEAIARGMRSAGYDLSEWSLPPEIRNPRPAEPQARKPSLSESSAQAPDVMIDTVALKSV